MMIALFFHRVFPAPQERGGNFVPNLDSEFRRSHSAGVVDNTRYVSCAQPDNEQAKEWLIMREKRGKTVPRSSSQP